MKNKLFIAANVLVALALGWLFLSSLDFGKMAAVVANASWPFLVLAALFYLAMGVLNAFRIKFAVDGKAKTSEIFLKHMTSMFLSDVTPARSGYATIVLKLRALGINTGHATKALGVLFATDFVGRAVLAFFALALFAGLVDQKLIVLAVLVLAAFSAALIYLMFREVRLLVGVLKKIPLFGERIAAAYGEAVSRQVTKKFLVLNVGASLFGAVLRGAAWTFILLSLGGVGGVGLVLTMTVLCALITAISFIPVSLAGIGLQEGAGAVLVSAVLGIGLVEAGSFMILVRLVEGGTDLLFGWPELLVNWRKKGVENV